MTENEEIKRASGESQLSPAELIATLQKMEHDSKEKLELNSEQTAEPVSEPISELISEPISENSNSSSPPSKKMANTKLTDSDKLNCHLCVPDHTFKTKSHFEKHVNSHKHKHMLSVYRHNEKCSICNSIQYNVAIPCKIEQCVPCNETNYPIWYDQSIKKEEVDYMDEITSDNIKMKETENKVLEKQIKEFAVLEELLKGVVDGFMAVDEEFDDTN